MYAYLWDRLNRLEQDLQSLRQENEELRKKLATIQPLRIERIEYKVQELQVETLSGTLDIGLSVKGDDQSIDRLVEKIKDGQNTHFQLGDQIPSPEEQKEENTCPGPEESTEKERNGNKDDHSDKEKDL
ncbi:spore germination protein GerPC [Paludifilum halophilum]|uniref:spore germination protein GerPC n=1 Tax=Paludifilum halophilum TaxID=1642702 RepID=UPI00146BB190|nr:spore germination protein GerPC [Paludifilum halophilum]